MAKIVKTFNLLTRFAVLSFFCILAISSISAVLLSNFMQDTLLKRDARVSKEFLETVVHTQISPAYFATGDVAQVDDFLETFFQRIGQIGDVVRSNIYTKDRTIIWSTRRELIGETFPANKELNQSLHGELIIHMGKVTTEQKEEHQNLELEVDQYVEYYIPIQVPASDEILMVVELYKEPKLLLEDIQKGTYLIWLSAFLGGSFLFVALFWIVFRANHLIALQQRALLDAQTMSVVGETASVFAHSIRNPLSSIRSSAELFQELGEGGEEFSADIISEVDRLDSWITELLSFTRDPQGADQKASDMREIISQCIEGFGERFQRHNIEVDWQLEQSLPPVWGDSRILGQVLISLITNALEAMPNGGKLSINGKSSAKGVLVELRDTGTGIPNEQLEGIFKPLVTHKSGGLGMGLPLARRALEKNGGSLELSSEVGVGTLVRVTLKVAEVQ